MNLDFLTMELVGKVAFGLYALAILAGGGLAVTSPSLIRAMVGLISALFGVAGMYFLMNAPLVALMQILIYVGAVSVLIFFAIMLAKAQSDGQEGKARTIWEYARSMAAFVVPAALLVIAAIVFGPEASWMPKDIPAAALGEGLLGRYTLAFELISVVLLAAMIGAVVLAFEKRGGK